MIIFPAIDVINGKCVRLTQGDYARKTVYREDPLEVAKEFEAAGLTHLHLVDLDGAKAGQVTNWSVIEAICGRTNLKVDVGGGIKTRDDLDRLFDIGVRQVNLGSVAVKNPDIVSTWIADYPGGIILSADVRGEQVAISGWQETSSLSVFDLIALYSSKGIEHVTCTDISTDGMLTGPAINLYKMILNRFEGIRLTASGGVGSIEHLEDLASAGVYGAIVGKAIYEGKVTLKGLAALNSD